MRRSINFSLALCASACLFVPPASAADARYEDREDAVILAFLKDRLAQAKGQPICFRPELAAAHPDTVASLRKRPPEPSTPASRTYSRDLSVWKGVPRRLFEQKRQLSIDTEAWRALNARPVSYGECHMRWQFGFNRAAIARSTAMIYGHQGNGCGATFFGANFRAVDDRWALIHFTGYYATFPPPGCGQLPILPERAAMAGYVMISERL
jgi:hypothetical protein